MTLPTSEWCRELAEIHSTCSDYKWSVSHRGPEFQKYAAALRVAARVLDEGAVEGLARVIMLSRPDHPGCDVKDWTAEARDNPHVEQAVNQARAVLAYLKGEQ
jgi:hypothetical protein